MSQQKLPTIVSEFILRLNISLKKMSFFLRPTGMVTWITVFVITGVFWMENLVSMHLALCPEVIPFHQNLQSQDKLHNCKWDHVNLLFWYKTKAQSLHSIDNHLIFHFKHKALETKVKCHVLIIKT